MNTQLKSAQILQQRIFKSLPEEDRESLFMLEERFRLTFSQLRQVATAMVDCRMWGESKLWNHLQDILIQAEQLLQKRQVRQVGDWIFEELMVVYKAIQASPKKYGQEGVREFQTRYRYENKKMEEGIFRVCPAASPNMVCCNLKTLNIVDNCAMGCTYCFMQNHFDEAVIKVPENLDKRLAEIQLDPNRLYRIGTGEYSDSLLWGNRNNILEHLAEFALQHPNILLELKTKSANIGYLLENNIPWNVCCSWSLNPETVVRNEEHGTASLEARLKAARKVADKGLPVAFHLHPMIWYEDWERDYLELIERIKTLFKPEEVLWISFGTITLIKGLEQKVRESFIHTRILQMELEETADQKFTYPFAIRTAMYKHAVKALGDWRSQVFHYLCMEDSRTYLDVLGYDYPSLEAMDDAFNKNIFAKLRALASYNQLRE
jgi:spore photoproduct lyase